MTTFHMIYRTGDTSELGKTLCGIVGAIIPRDNDVYQIGKTALAVKQTNLMQGTNCPKCRQKANGLKKK